MLVRHRVRPDGRGLAVGCPRQELWACLDDLDAHAWVLDGEALPRSSTQRRVALGGHASVTIHLAPTAPCLPPACHFLGAVRRHPVSIWSMCELALIREITRLSSKGPMNTSWCW